MPPESFERLIRDRPNEGAELRREFAQTCRSPDLNRE